MNSKINIVFYNLFILHQNCKQSVRHYLKIENQVRISGTSKAN